MTVLSTSKAPHNINVIQIAQDIIEQYPDSIIFGDYARALKSDTFLEKDVLHLITSDMEVVVDTCVRLRTKIGIYKRTRDNVPDNSVRALIVCASVGEDPEFEDINSGVNTGYLTSYEWKKIKHEPHAINTITYSHNQPCVPDLARVVWEISCADLNNNSFGVMVHVVKKDVHVEEYAQKLALKISEKPQWTCNLNYIKGGNWYGTISTSLSDLEDKVLRSTGNKPVMKDSISSAWKRWELA